MYGQGYSEDIQRLYVSIHFWQVESSGKAHHTYFATWDMRRSEFFLGWL